MSTIHVTYRNGRRRRRRGDVYVERQTVEGKFFDGRGGCRVGNTRRDGGARRGDGARGGGIRGRDHKGSGVHRRGAGQVGGCQQHNGGGDDGKRASRGRQNGRRGRHVAASGVKLEMFSNRRTPVYGGRSRLWRRRRWQRVGFFFN